MSLQEQINKDIVTAMKEKNKESLDVLRYIKSLFIQNNTSVKPTDDLSVVIGHVKKLQDSLESYTAGTEAHTKIMNEVKIAQAYLPQPLTEAEVVAIINDLKIKGAKNLGEMMKDLQPQIKGRFDGKKATDLVKAAFA